MAVHYSESPQAFNTTKVFLYIVTVLIRLPHLRDKALATLICKWLYWIFFDSNGWSLLNSRRTFYSWLIILRVATLYGIFILRVRPSALLVAFAVINLWRALLFVLLLSHSLSWRGVQFWSSSTVLSSEDVIAKIDTIWLLLLLVQRRKHVSLTLILKAFLVASELFHRLRLIYSVSSRLTSIL